MPYVWADRSDFKTVLEKIAQCFPSGITQFLNQHTSKYQKRSKHFVCTRLPGSSMFCIGWQPDYYELKVSTCKYNQITQVTGWIEKGQRNKQGRMEEEANQPYWRLQTTGQAREEDDTVRDRHFMTKYCALNKMTPFCHLVVVHSSM